jgi:hypothetical protein
LRIVPILGITAFAVSSRISHDVAEFMAAELERRKFLDQESVVQQIMKKFGPEFTGTNANGNPQSTRTC